MKQNLVLLLSIIIMFPSIGNVLIYTQFKVSQDEIARTICVQRKMVLNSCNGRCELQKSLKKFDDNEKKMNNFLKEKVEIVYVQNSVDTDYSIIIPEFYFPINFMTFDKKPISIVLSNFRPPTYFI